VGDLWRAALLCPSGEEEADLDLGELVRKNHVAWLSAEEMAAAAEAAAEEPNGAAVQEYRSSALAPQQQQQQQQHAETQQQQRGMQIGYGDPPQLSSGGLQVYDDPFERMMNVNGRHQQLASHYV
jgi:hypothetical protein